MDYNYKHTDFFGFDVEYIIADNTRLYRVSSLVNEVNKKHNVRVSFIDFIEFLRDKRIKQIIHYLYRKSCDSTIPLITFPQYGNKYAISGVIKPELHYSDYLICEELLFQFLLWLDPLFVSDLYSRIIKIWLFVKILLLKLFLTFYANFFMEVFNGVELERKEYMILVVANTILKIITMLKLLNMLNNCMNYFTLSKHALNFKKLSK